jgi:cytochrome c peroxidase
MDQPLPAPPTRSRRTKLAVLAGVLIAGAAALLAGLMAQASPPDFSDAEKATIASLALAGLPPLPADPTNRVADVPAAQALGATLFFDHRLSRDGKVACDTCHKIDRQFQDDLPRAVATGTNNRRTMPLAGVAWSQWFFWDGRRDSLWAQAITPLEDKVEHAGNRTAYARFMFDNFHDRYERIFGPFPPLDGLPQNASPLGTPSEQAAWAAMTDGQRDAVNLVFANIGKLIGAFERSLTFPETRFDRFAEALAAGKTPAPADDLTAEERAGLQLFIGKADCVRCHSGPRFSDGKFHNTGVPPVAGLPEDLGRETGVTKVAADPFNCLGKFRDGDNTACTAMHAIVAQGPGLRRAYKTPSLRGVADRPPYMHAGQFATLDAVIDHDARAPEAASGHTELKPLALSDSERGELIAFLKTLSALPPTN